MSPGASFSSRSITNLSSLSPLLSSFLFLSEFFSHRLFHLKLPPHSPLKFLHPLHVPRGAFLLVVCGACAAVLLPHSQALVTRGHAHVAPGGIGLAVGAAHLLFLAFLVVVSATDELAGAGTQRNSLHVLYTNFELWTLHLLTSICARGLRDDDVGLELRLGADSAAAAPVLDWLALAVGQLGARRLVTGRAQRRHGGPGPRAHRQ